MADITTRAGKGSPLTLDEVDDNFINLNTFTQSGTGAVDREVTDKLKDTVSVKDFGAVGDGVTDDTAFIQAALNAAADFQIIVIPAGSYKLSETITGSLKNYNIDATGAVFYPTTNVPAFNFNNTSDVVVSALSSNYSTGSTSITVTALSAALSSGAPFKIISNAVDPYNRDSGSSTNQYRVGEWAIAASSNTTTTINLLSPLLFSRGIDPTSIAGNEPAIDSYTTAMNAKVVIPVNRTIVWRGGTIIYPNGYDASWTSSAFNVNGYIHPRITNLSIKRGYGAGIGLNGCYNAVISKCYISNLNNNTSLGQYGYGIADASWMTVVRDCYFANTRHGYTTNAVTIPANSQSLNSGRVFGALVIGCSGTGTTTAVFDSHHDAHNLTFDSCTAFGGNSYGFAVRGKSVSVNNCQAINSASGITVFTESAPGDPDDDLLTAAQPDGFTTCQINNFKGYVIGLPINTLVCTCNINCADLKSTGMRMLYNEYSSVTLSGLVKFQTTTYFGAYALTADASNSAVLESLHASATPAVNCIANGCYLDIDASTISASTTTPYVFKNTTSGGQLIIEGKVNAKVASTFAGLFTGNLGSYITGNGDLVWEVDGAVDNTIQTSTLNSLKARIRANSVDKLVFHDWRTNIPQKSILIYSNTKHDGTGSAVTDALTIPYQAVEGLKETGSTIIYRLKLQKSGTNGTAAFTINTSAVFFDTITLAADAGLFYVDAQFITTASNEIRGLGEIRVWSNVPAFATIQPKVRTQTGSPFASTDKFLRITINAASGDSITLHQYEIISNNISVGLS